MVAADVFARVVHGREVAAGDEGDLVAVAIVIGGEELAGFLDIPCAWSLSASQLMAQVILPLGQPRAKASRRDRMRSGRLSAASSSPMLRVGVTSI